MAAVYGAVPGECPKCKSSNLNYGAIEPEDGSIYYPFTCEDCKSKGREYFNLDYSETRMDFESA